MRNTAMSYAEGERQNTPRPPSMREQRDALLAACENLAQTAEETTKDIIGFDGAGALDKSIDIARAAIRKAKA